MSPPPSPTPSMCPLAAQALDIPVPHGSFGRSHPASHMIPAPITMSDDLGHLGDGLCHNGQ